MTQRAQDLATAHLVIRGGALSRPRGDGFRVAWTRAGLTVELSELGGHWSVSLAAAGGRPRVLFGTHPFLEDSLRAPEAHGLYRAAYQALRAAERSRGIRVRVTRDAA